MELEPIACSNHFLQEAEWRNIARMVVDGRLDRPDQVEQEKFGNIGGQDENRL